MKRKAGKRRGGGTVTVLVAVSLTGILGAVAIALDGGLMLDYRRRVQAAADAGALAAASDLATNFGTNKGLDSIGGTATSESGVVTAGSSTFGPAAFSALSTALANVPNSTVTVNIPPTAGNYINTKGYVEVIVTYNQTAGFSAMFGYSTIPVSARAVARGTSSAASGAGLILLNKSAKTALKTVGNGALTVNGGGIIVDSNDSEAIFINGSGTISATFVNVVGSVFGNSGNISGTLTTGVTLVPDPLAAIPAPSSASLTAGNIVSSGANSYGGTAWTLSPGIWGTGGGTFPNFGSKDTIILQQASAGNQGIYYLASGGFNFDGLSVQMAGSGESGGLMFYNASSSAVFSLQINNNSTLSTSFSPLTTGIYQGISYFQNRSGTQDVTLDNGGSGSFTISGTVYAPGANMNLTGNAGDSFSSQLIVDQMKLAGNGNATFSYSSNTVAQANSIALVE